MKKKTLLFMIFISYLCANSYQEGINFYKKSLYKEAMEQFLSATQENDNRAMLAIGIMYANGDGVKKDLNKSLKWYKSSAKLGNTNAYDKLANYYASKQKYKKSFKWFEKLAQSGDPKAAYALGYFYTGGLGVKHDLKASLKWYEKSAEAGYIDAQLNLAFMYIGGQGTKVDYKKAAFWIYKAKEKGNIKAQTMWDEFHLSKHYKPKNNLK